METISDVILSGIEYENIYDLAGITDGRELIIQNKSSNVVYVQLSDTQPSVNSKDGICVEIDHKFPVKVKKGFTGVWIKGSGPISVQNLDSMMVHTVDVVSNAQNPLAIDGDSVYAKDIDLESSDNGDFTGNILDYFNSLKTVTTNNTTDNPKSIKIIFKRSLQTNSIGFGCDDLTKSFSNIVVKALGSGEEIRYTYDGSSDSTKRNSYLIKLTPLALNGFIIEFHTEDAIGLSNIIIFKTKDVNARLQAEKDDGEIVNLLATDSGNLRVANVEDGLSIAQGNVSGASFIHKFGNAPDFATANGFVSIWDGADNTNISQLIYQYSTTNDIDSLVSSSASDTVNIEIQGLDINYNVITQTIKLTGQTRVPLSTNLIRVFRLKNVGNVNLVGFVSCYVNTTLSGGIPIDRTKIRAIINGGNNQTLMAIYTIPAGKTGYMRDWYAATSGANKTSNYIIDIKARPFGQVFQLKHRSSLSDTGSSNIQHYYNEPEKFTEKTDVEMRVKMTAVGGSGGSVSAGFDIVLIDN